jgi:hypothetical protein
MIKLEIRDRKLYCEISNDIIIPENYFPLKFKVKELITNKTKWEIDLSPGMWATWDWFRDVNATVETCNGIILKEFNYNYEIEDLTIYGFWDYFCRINKTTTGLILGCGNGTWGEWVVPVNRENMTCHLVEASRNTFRNLSENYKNSSNFILYDDVITIDGLDCNFYEGEINGDGLNSINFEYLKKIDSESNLKFELRKTKSIMDLLEEIGKVDWIRLDIEGSDYDILKKIPREYLENLIMIQYENFHLSEEKKKEVDDLILPLGFRKLVFGIDTIYYK